jgi:hypothetical protein
MQRSEVLASRAPAKPDFVKATLNAQELHAYYMAFISSQRLSLAGCSLLTRT